MSLRKTKKGKSKNSNRFLLLIVACFVLLGGFLLFVMMNLTDENKNAGNSGGGVKDTKNARLTDPDLIFANIFHAGLCSDDKGNAGGCVNERYIYSSGLVIDESVFYPNKGMKKVEPTVRRQLKSEGVEKIIQAMRDSGLMKDNCRPQRVMDVALEYRINPDGKQKVISSYPSEDCLEKLRTIDGIVDEVLE